VTIGDERHEGVRAVINLALRDRVVITGRSRGIGTAAAILFAAEGARAMLSAARAGQE
jgi:NAD(P)-dependent dehydrogenase (short-subunit alcohol dehydrogenase family)